MKRPEDGHVTLNGTGFRYRDWGDQGQPVVLLHGLASTSHIWDLVAPLLSSDFAVVALDQRGHGESDKPATGYDFATVARDLQSFVDALGLQNPIVVGHSWGGNVAVEHAATYPSAALGICLLDGGTIEISAWPDMSLARAREKLAPPDFTGVTLDELRERSKDRDWGFEITAEVERIMLSNFEVLEDGTLRARFPRRHHMTIIDEMWKHRPSELLSSIECPVLLMPTRRTTNNTDLEQERKERAVKRAGALLPVSKTVWFDDSVHDVPLQRPEAVARVITEHIRGGFFDT